MTVFLKEIVFDKTKTSSSRNKGLIMLFVI
jgi:hypothetical protein